MHACCTKTQIANDLEASVTCAHSGVLHIVAKCVATSSNGLSAIMAFSFVLVLARVLYAAVSVHASDSNWQD